MATETTCGKARESSHFTEPLGKRSSRVPLQAGYLAFGKETQDIITFNLPNNWMAAAVKLSLCIGLFFTFPPMMIPVYQIVERKLAAQVRL